MNEKMNDQVTFKATERQKHFLSHFPNQSEIARIALDEYIDRGEAAYLKDKSIFESIPSKQGKHSDE